MRHRAPDTEFIGAEEASEFLGISEATLCRLRKDNLVPIAGTQPVNRRSPDGPVEFVIYSRVDLQDILDNAERAGYKKGAGMHLRRFITGTHNLVRKKRRH